MELPSYKKALDQAPQSYFGYSLQLNRAFLHLHAGTAGDVVSIEHLDDVAVTRADGTIFVEQVTTSLEGNPVSNRAEKFWKTIANWCRGVESAHYPANTTKFHLYVLQKPTPGKLVNIMNNARNEQEARSSLDEIRKEFWGAAPKFRKKSSIPVSLKPHIELLLQADDHHVLPVIQNFTLHLGDGDPVAPLLAAVSNTPFGPKRVKHFVRYALGSCIRECNKSSQAINQPQ